MTYTSLGTERTDVDDVDDDDDNIGGGDKVEVLMMTMMSIVHNEGQKC